MTIYNINRICIILSVIISSFWVFVSYISAHHYGYPSMDSWCYTAPWVYSPHPFSLSTPLLGNFHASDTSWGLHFPGGQMLMTLLPSFIPRTSSVIVLCYIFIQFLVAVEVALIIQNFTSNVLVSCLGLLFVLWDKSAATILWLQRTELIAAFLATSAILIIQNPNWRKSVLPQIGLYSCLFLLPTVGPVSVFVGAAIAGWLFLDTLLMKQNIVHKLLPILVYAMGVMLLALYYYTNHEMYMTFLDHAKSGLEITKQSKIPFWGYNTFAFQTLYKPFFLGTLAQLLSILYILWASWKFLIVQKKNISETWFHLSQQYLVFFCLLAALFSMQNTYNGFYIVATLPFATILGAIALNKIFKSRNIAFKTEVIIVLLITLLSSSYLLARTYKWFRDGGVNYHEKIAQFYSMIPQGGVVLVPESLWESAYNDKKHQIILNSLPYNARQTRQQEYLHYLETHYSNFDYFVVDRLQSHPSGFFEEHKAELTPIFHVQKTWLNSGVERGIDLTLYKNNHPSTMKFSN